MFDVWEAREGDTFAEGWKNKLIWGDNKYVMSSLLDKFAGKIDLIYIDPPFATGADFNFTAQIGEGDLEVFKEQSIIEEKAYRDTWAKGIDSYLQMMHERVVLMKDLLADTGSIYVHLDWHVGHYVKAIMDEIFGREKFRNEIVWRRHYSHNDGNRYGYVHDIILWFSKSGDYVWNRVFLPYDQGYIEKNYPYVDEATGRRYRSVSMNAAGQGEPRYFGDKLLSPPPGTHWRWSQDRVNQALRDGIIYFSSSGVPRYKQFLEDVEGLPVQDTWIDFYGISSQSGERLGFDTQKPEALLERIINASSNEGNLVADFFCGSGTTLAVAEKLGRRWIGCDLSRWAIHITRKRLLGIENCKPFEVLNLGKYERKYWQGVTFGGKKPDQQLAIFEYLAFILRLYGAQPLSGMEHLHGKKGNAVVHVGAVDAPVTIDEINACLDECLAIKQKELHILGWEWEMGLYDIITDAAKGRGIKLVLRTIPREVMEQQAVDRGDINFFELAYLEADIQQKNRQVVVALQDFVIPNTELIPDEVRGKVKKWSDYIDYWAVDWDFQNDTFMNGWVAYRTRKQRALSLKADPHTYDRPGKYTIMVKVVDIFGIDTSQAFEVEVR